MTARELALMALLRAHQGDTFVQDELHGLMARHNLSPADRALATEIALGATRHRRTIDYLLDRLLTQPIAAMDLTARRILEIAAYQMIYLDRVPDYAVVDEAVTLMRSRGQERLTGLTNAVLRKVPTLLDRQSTPGRAATDPRSRIPGPRGQWIALSGPLLPENPVLRVGVAASYPDFLVKRWQQRWGEGEAERIMLAMNRPPTLYARVNTLRTTRESLLAMLTPDERRTVVTRHVNVLDLTGIDHGRLVTILNRGLVTIEDLTAMRAVEALGVKPGMTVLDLCAAPGGKTSYIAELLRGQGTVWALDRAGARLDLLQETIDRLALKNVHVAANDPDRLPKTMPVAFDRVLVDVPCSNTGVLGRRVDARWRLANGLPAGLAETQATLLTQAVSSLAPGGLCVYSTCSIEPEENGAIVRRVLESCHYVSLQAERETRPGPDGDGGYFAVLARLKK